MHLFKSQWLQEAADSTRTSARHDPAFGPCYGSRAVSRRMFGPSTTPAHADSPVVTCDFHGERAILRALAEYDRAA